VDNHNLSQKWAPFYIAWNRDFQQMMSSGALCVVGSLVQLNVASKPPLALAPAFENSSRVAGGPCPMAACLYNLAWNYSVFVEPVHCTESMVSVGDQEFAALLVPYQQNRRNRLTTLDLPLVLLNM